MAKKFSDKVSEAVDRIANLAESLSAHSDMERIHRLVIVGLYIDGAAHKQWYLYEIADELGIPVRDWDVDSGIAPR